jgi:hypothetical protein
MEPLRATEAEVALKAEPRYLPSTCPTAWKKLKPSIHQVCRDLLLYFCVNSHIWLQNIFVPQNP